MSRGTVHLLLCRLVAGAMILPGEVHGPLDLAGYLACNYLKYLDVSGRFHIACGMLHLFGFGLPETHHNYLLAPELHRLLAADQHLLEGLHGPRGLQPGRLPPEAPAARRSPLAAATTAVFVATWLLHAYQSFWLRGTWGFSVPDALFWGILGALVLVNVQLDARRPDGAVGNASACRRWPCGRRKTAGTFATIALLWSLWSSPSVGAWLGLLRRGLG